MPWIASTLIENVPPPAEPPYEAAVGAVSVMVTPAFASVVQETTSAAALLLSV